MHQRAIIMFAAAPISLSPPRSSFPGSCAPRDSRSLSAVVDSMVMRSPTAVFFRSTKWLCNPLSPSPNKLMALSALSSSEHSNPSYREFKKEFDEIFNYDLGKESDFNISLPYEEVPIFIERLLKDTDTGTIRTKITVVDNVGGEQVHVTRSTKPPPAEDGSRDCHEAFNFTSKIQPLLLVAKSKHVKIEIKVMSRESQLCVLTEASTFAPPRIPLIKSPKSD